MCLCRIYRGATTYEVLDISEMVNDDVYVVEIIAQYNFDNPSGVADFNTYTKLF